MARIRAALVTPLSGPLAPFGTASANGLRLWAEHAAQLIAPWTGVELAVHDTGKDVSASIHAALAANPDVLFGPYGSHTMLAAARATQRVIWNHGGATSQLSRPTFPHIINVLSPASTYFAAVLEAIHASDPQATTVSLFHSSSGFGRDVAQGAIHAANSLNFTMQSIPFEPHHALESSPLVPQADILLVVGNFADELAVAPALLQRSWRSAAFVGAGVEEVLAPLGAKRAGLIGPAQWIASAALEPDEGPNASWFVSQYRNITGSEPPYPAAQAFAAGLLYARCLRDSGSTSDTSLHTAASTLTCRTLYGDFRIDPITGLQSGHQVLITQWHNNTRHIVWPHTMAQQSLIVHHKAKS